MECTVIEVEDPNPLPITNNQRSGVKVDATNLLFSLKNTLTSLSQRA